MNNKDGAVPRRQKPAVGLIFAENANDADALSLLTKAIWHDAPVLRYRRKPLVLIRDKQEAEARKRNADDIGRVIKAEQVIAEVRVVIAHKDYDAVEPADKQVAALIKSTMAAIGFNNVIAATPAWETEAWWFMWPSAVAAVHAKWTPLKRTGNHGKLVNAKEVLRRDLRNSATRRDYEESDSKDIAANVLKLGLIDRRVGSCNSFDDFRRQVRSVAKLD